MAISGSGNILLGTQCFNHDLQLLETFPNHGDLRDCTEDNHAIFRQDRREGGYMLSIWKLGSQQPVMTLQPPAGETWSECLSVCYVASRIVVVDAGHIRRQGTIHLYTNEGNMHQLIYNYAVS